MDAVDNEIPEPARLVDLPFLMPVEDVFTITGRGTVATGRIERGVINVNNPVEIIGMMKEGEKPLHQLLLVLRCLENYLIDGEVGDNAGLLLRGIDKTQIERSGYLCSRIC